MLVMPQIC
jgi:hypothetical protein